MPRLSTNCPQRSSHSSWTLINKLQAVITFFPLARADQMAVERASANWMVIVTLGTSEAPKQAADLYAPDGVLWGTEVYAPNDPLWEAGSEVVRNTPEQIYAYYVSVAVVVVVDCGVIGGGSGDGISGWAERSPRGESA